MANTVCHIVADVQALVAVQSRWATDPAVQARILINANASHALNNVRLNETVVMLARNVTPAKPDKQARMRPRRLRQIFDRGTDATVPFNQQNVPGRMISSSFCGSEGGDSPSAGAPPDK